MKINSKIIIGGIGVIVVLALAYSFLDSILFDGVKPRPVSNNGIQATFFAKDGTQNQTAVILIGGGYWGDYWGQEMAKAGYSGLSLPYTRQAGLPELPEEIPLEYFEKALNWLKEQPEVEPDRIVVMGASRNAELALVIASYYPESIHGAITFSPSAVSWSNTVLPFNSDEIKPSWTIKNKPVPYIPMEKIKGGETENIETLPYWKQGLLDSTVVSNAAIRVERINGPILLLSGLDDEVWPSAYMADMIESRLSNSSYTFDVENIKYENAGHMVSGNPNNPSGVRGGKMTIEGKTYDFNFGGTAEGDMAAQRDAARRVFEFISKLNDSQPVSRAQ